MQNVFCKSMAGTIRRNHHIALVQPDRQIINYERACLIIIWAKKPFFVAAL